MLIVLGGWYGHQLRLHSVIAEDVFDRALLVVVLERVVIISSLGMSNSKSRGRRQPSWEWSWKTSLFRAGLMLPRIRNDQS
jgi:hypothetical protein